MTGIASTTQFENVTLKSQRLVLLERFKEQCVRITVILPGSPAEYTSAILSIRPDEEFVILDELKPEEGHQRFMEVKECTVEIYYKGEGIRFTGRLLSKGTKGGTAFYVIPLPPSIHHYLQQVGYRVPITPPEKMPIYLQNQDQDPLEGEVVDLSSGGVGFTAPRTPWTEAMKQGDQITSCRFALNTGETVNCALEVRGVRPGKDKNDVRIGARLVDLDEGQIKMLERYIITLDRERLKSLAEL